MYLFQSRFRDPMYLSGLLCIAVSLFFFCLPFFVNVDKDQMFGLFMVNFAITWIYFILNLSRRRRIEPGNQIHYTFLFLFLFLISAYSLNREMTVFEDSVSWFSALLVISCINYGAFSLANALPKWTLHLMSFVAGTSWVTFAYLSLYLLPMYGIGIAGFFLLGLSLHTFVPLLFTIYSLLLMGKTARTHGKYWLSFSAGLLSVVGFVLCYAIMWNDNKKELETAWQSSLKNTNDLPSWINIAESTPDNFFTRKLLRTDLVYSSPESGRESFFLGIPSRNFGEAKKHDPLVLSSVFLTGKIQFDIDIRKKILESNFRLRHEAEDRLWSGDHLSTSKVNTEVRFWPACNITYTEKTITVSNNNSNRAGRTQEEAIYTFYMPEGAVVTSLSLWINGKEEKGILASKAKA
ncbi:MAG TPA: XrtN system VIT domain-containing protein, partial [Chitinophagaceae bacterium]|nr:XrtN system VIT domain-containing protein [Chitinophagaceae bacterium]